MERRLFRRWMLNLTAGGGLFLVGLIATNAAQPLVVHDDGWYYRKGTSAPQADWKTVPDTGLDTSWAMGPGGFGYADNSAETAACATLFSDMRTSYTTFYVRQSFEVPTDPAADWLLKLRVDWDDGFVAWLDGVYLTSRNSPAGTGEPGSGQSASGDHESSRGNTGPQPAEIIVLGKAADRLPAGTHTLALMALNRSLTSSDCILIADLYLEEVTGSTNTVSGPIAVDTLWTEAASPYHVIGGVTVNAGVTLTIEPGVKVEFDQGLGLLVQGRLLAEGTAEQPLSFVPAADATSWGRIEFSGGVEESRIVHATIDGAAGRGNVTADHSTILLQHVVFTNTTTQMVTVDDTSVDIRFCTFPSISGDELIHFLRMPPNGHALIHSNYFGTTTGYNDIIDFTGGNRPGPIPEFIGNVFDSAVDDCFDMDGTDAHIEGNVFLNVRQEAVRDSSSNPISTGADGGETSELVIARNIFVNCEHSLLLKDAGSAVMQNNTILTITTNALGSQPPGIINFSEANRGTVPGSGALFEGNIVWDLRAEPWVNFDNATMFLEVSQSLIQGTNWPGPGNLSEDPLFVDPTNLTWENVWDRLGLRSGSPALGAGPNGLDMGAVVPGGASISGEPPGVTTESSALLKVAGPGIYAYKWRLNDGPWSEEIALTNSLLISPTLFVDAPPISLTGLVPGTYEVSVIGKNSAGNWQSEANVTRSKPWTVLADIGEGEYPVGGVLAGDTTWSPDLGEIRVVAPLTVPAGVTLRVEAGTMIWVDPGMSISVTDGSLVAEGFSGEEIRLAASDGASPWGPLRVAGADSVVYLAYVEVDHGHLDLRDGVVATLEDCWLQDFQSGSTAILRALRPELLVMRRCHFSGYYEVLSQLAVNEIEDCLFEDIHGDGLDFDGALPGSFLRNCTFRHGLQTNVDAFDIGNYSDGTVSDGVTVEGCLMYDFPYDKGISIGERARNIIVRNCVIYGVDIGVAVKDSSVAQIHNNTIIDSNHGFRFYEKVAGQGGGHAETWNNILWGNGSSVTLDSLSTVTAGYSDIEGGYTGDQNLNVDPGFWNPTEADYRLGMESPVRGQGLNGVDMGALFPVGSSLVDSDADGLPDPWEQRFGLDPHSATDAATDLDTDGLSNVDEYRAGTDPLSAESVLALEVVDAAGGELELRFEGRAGRRYRLEFLTESSVGPWQLLSEVTPDQDGAVVVRDPESSGAAARWYQLRLMAW